MLRYVQLVSISLEAWLSPTLVAPLLEPQPQPPVAAAEFDVTEPMLMHDAAADAALESELHEQLSDAALLQQLLPGVPASSLGEAAEGGAREHAQDVFMAPANEVSEDIALV